MPDAPEPPPPDRHEPGPIEPDHMRPGPDEPGPGELHEGDSHERGSDERDSHERGADGQGLRGGVPRGWGALAGLCSLGAALATGSLIAAAGSSFESPVVSVGDRVIDLAPAVVRETAIDTLGTLDKPALVAGTVVLLALLSVAAGIRAVRGRTGSALALVAVAVAAGAAAGTTGRDGTALGWVPSVLSGAAAALSLLLLGRTCRPVRTAAAGDGAASPSEHDRRRFLGGAGSVALGAAVVAATARLFGRTATVPVSTAVAAGRVPDRPLAPPPADPAATIAGLTPLLVPSRDFYRIDTALVVPRVSADEWALTIDGMVERPLRLTYADLWERELIELDATLCCVSNEIGGDLVGTARWVGVRLDTLLDEASVRPDADQVMTHSVDGFTAGFPVEAAFDGRDAIVALAMGGEVLPVIHGYPARLVVPGLYGYVSATKWLSRLELTRFDRARGYWIPRGWAVQAPVKTQSRIDTPRPGRTVRPGTVAIGGVAWAPVRGIARVEVQVDDGPWQEAELGPALSDAAWRQWWLPWTATPGNHVLRCRATDGDGVTQTATVTETIPDGATGWHRVTVTVDD